MTTAVLLCLTMCFALWPDYDWLEEAIPMFT
jgi:hypothetical protein